MKNIALSENALHTACHPEFPSDQILSSNPPNFFANLLIREHRNTIFVSTKNCDKNSKFMIIGRRVFYEFDKIPQNDHGIFFERCVRLGLRGFNKRIALSPNAMPYHDGNRISVYASPNSKLRILGAENYAETGNVYIYGLKEAEDTWNLKNQEPDPIYFEEAAQDIQALLYDAVSISSHDDNAIELEWSETTSIAKGFGYDEWFRILSPKQKDFVTRDVIGPLRVRGSAGTGKTLAMVMKALRIIKDAADSPCRILFLTHSWAIAGQIDEMIRNIGRDIPRSSEIEIFPLVAMAQQRDYIQAGRQPLGTDSDSGIRRTMDAITRILDKFLESDWIAYRAACSDSFVERFESDPNSRERRSLIWDILIEFACVLAADGLRSRPTDRERYLRIRRVGYMMYLSSQAEKEVIFLLWKEFFLYLRDSGFIATDQIVSDYLNDLHTFYWEAKRNKAGYDYIFVDEMHLFNAQERLVFHNLMADGDITPRVILALDPKQSPREVFAEIVDDRDQYNGGIYQRAGLPNPEKIDFVEIYRYTKEISVITHGVLDSVPGLDMNEDWNLPSSHSVKGHGPRPQYIVVADLFSTLSISIKTAKKMRSSARSRMGQVAVLCLDYDRFVKLYPAAAGQNPNDIYVISSRDDIEQLRFMKQRIVFSTPEYVAGLQFDTVILVDANADLVPDGSYRGRAERRFLSELYLGLSRAENQLILIASRDCGGLTPYLQSYIDNGDLEEMT